MNIRFLTEAKLDLSRYDDKPSFSQSITVDGKKTTLEFYCFKDDKATLPSITMHFLADKVGKNFENFRLEVEAGTKKIILGLNEPEFPNGTFKIYEEMFGEDIRVRPPKPPKPGDAGREFTISKEIKHHSGGKTIIEFDNPKGEEIKISETHYRWNTHVTVQYNGKCATHDVKARTYTITPENFMNEDWELTRSTYKDPKDYEAFVAPPKKTAPTDSYTSFSLYSSRVPEKKREPIQSIGDYPLPTSEKLNEIFGIENLVKDIERGKSDYGYSVTINLNKYQSFSRYKNTVEYFLRNISGAKLSEDGPNPSIKIPKNIESFTQFIEACDAHKPTLTNQFSRLTLS